MTLLYDRTGAVDVYINELRVRCKVLTEFERRKFVSLCDKLRTESSDSAASAAMDEALSLIIVGPVDAVDGSGAPVPMTIEGFLRLFSFIEIMSFIDRLPFAVMLGEADKKKLQPPWRLSTTPPKSADNATDAKAGTA